MKQLVIIIATFLFYFQANSQSKQASEVPSPIVFIYDASGSMWGQIQGKTKTEIAATVLSNSINNFAENQRIGLVAYGHRKKGDCDDVETLLSQTNTSKSEVAKAVKSIKPLGMTPLAHSASTVFDQIRISKEKATIVLITDGIESCDGNICDVVLAAKKEGIDFKLHIVGFGLKPGETEQLECAAKAGDGNYYDAADASGLGDALTEVATQTVDKPKGNLGVYVSKNGKPLDAQVQAYMAGTNNQADQGRTYTDTTYLYLPQGTYYLKVWQHSISSITPISVNNVKTYNDKMTYQTVSLDGAKLTFNVTNNGKMWDSQIRITTPTGQNVMGSRTYAKSKTLEVDAGTYNVTFIARDVSGLASSHTLENVSVGSGEITEISHDFKTAEVNLGANHQGKIFDVLIRIKDFTTGKDIAGIRTYTEETRKLILNPGKYTVSMTEVGVYNSSAKGAEFTIEVNEGETLTTIKEVK
ncbi:VWA domain-containing protein [uncultured Cyclobacterium sp.]|uniref:vWA domain-containing protein n=1 Tax=uncultured Cyclobacterium sp. TaxID=453820 RepID=UPI0030EB7B2D|tara:strand:- start:114762 stop:116174 length:1413 start_codon:yes stop_codon:yes gene_type:complete